MATTGHENEAVKISGLKANEKKLVNLLPFNEVICSTAAATAAKVANTTPASFNLVAKATIVVKFTYGITVANATFQVGTTAAKPIYYKGAALPANLVKAGMTVTLRYDGTNYNIVGTLDNETDIAYDTTNKKITKTVNGTTSDVVTSEKVVEDGGGMNLVEGYYYNKKFYKEATHTTEITGADGRIYIDKDTNREYRFDGTKYVLLKSEVDGSFVSEGTFTYRPTAGALDVESGAVGEGGAQIECVKGNTVPWNQLQKNTTSRTTGGVTYTYSNGYLTISASGGTRTNSWWLGSSDFIWPFTSGHKILVIGKASVCYIPDIGENGGDLRIRADKEIITVLTTANSYLQVSIPSTFDLSESFTIAPQLFDLTLIYGEGNEPTTPEQFEADYQKWFGKPLTYEEYDAGSLRSVEMTGIKTTGFNQVVSFTNGSASGQYNTALYANAVLLPNTQYAITFIGKENHVVYSNEGLFSQTETLTCTGQQQTITVTIKENIQGGLDNYTIFKNAPGNEVVPNFTELCISMRHSGARDGQYEPYWEHTASLPVTQLKGKLDGEGSSVVIFPDGLKKAGSVYDEIVKRGNQTVAIKRIGSVDLGTVSWEVQYNVFCIGSVSGKHHSDHYCAGVCSKYSVHHLTNWNENFPPDTISLGSTDTNITFRSSETETRQSITTKLSGVMLYYQLETPEEYIIDDIDFPTEYPVDDYGTEEILSDSAKSLAPTLDIRYGLNATDTLRNLPSKYVSAVEEQNFTEAQKARARKNIGAASEEDMVKVKKQIEAISKVTESDLWVDMGLPSGLLWAKKNIDVTQSNGFTASEYQYECSFFSWGNTDGHNPISSSAFDYDWGTGNDTEPYVSSPGAALTGNAGLSYDAARVNLGSPWRLPTTDEFKELFDNCDFIDASGNTISSSQLSKLVTMNSVVGIRLKSKVNGNILFFPCSGYGDDTSLSARGMEGDYWTLSLYSSIEGYVLNINTSNVRQQHHFHRYYGFPVRPVM